MKLKRRLNRLACLLMSGVMAVALAVEIGRAHV